MRTASTLRRGLVPLCLAVGLTLAGCSGSGSASTVDDQVGPNQVDGEPDAAAPGVDLAEPEAAAEDGAAAEGEESGGRSAGGEGGEQDVALAGTVGRDLVFRASITLASDDPDATAADVRGLAADAGGFVSDAQLQRNDLGLLAGSITIRVPSESLDDLLSQVSDAGADVVAEQRSTEDVTGQLTDIDAQLRNLGALEEELLVVLGDAREQGEVDDIVTVFDRVAAVRGEIEVLEGRRAGLSDLVALSTLTVFIEPSRAAVAEATQVPEADRPLPWSPGNEATSAWDQTVAAARTFVDGVIWVGVYLVPIALLWLLPIGIVVLLVRAWWRRRGDASPGATGGAVAPADPVPPSTPTPDDPSTAVDETSDPGDADSTDHADDVDREPVGV